MRIDIGVWVGHLTMLGQDSWHHLIDGYSMATGNKKAYDYLAGTIESFPTQESLSNQLKAVGYADVKAVGLTFSVVAIHVALKQ